MAAFSAERGILASQALRDDEPPPRDPSTPVSPQIKMNRESNDSRFIFSGKRGIRTPGGVTLNGFQDRRNRPLCHLSIVLADSLIRFCAAKLSIIFGLCNFTQRVLRYFLQNQLIVNHIEPFAKFLAYFFEFGASGEA